MAIPDIERKRVEKALDEFCDRVPLRARDQLAYEYKFRGNAVAVYERRPPWDGRGREWTSHSVAKFNYDPKKQNWTLQWADRNSRWHNYEGYEGVRQFQDLVDEVNRDPTGIFFG